MDTISSLQQEMKTEQESFNSLSQQLEGLRDKRTQQYRQISKDLMASQSRLTLLMNRSMQCFSQVKIKKEFFCVHELTFVLDATFVQTMLVINLLLFEKQDSKT